MMIILIILGFLLIISLMVCFSNVNIEIGDLIIDTENKEKLKQYLLIVNLKLFNKIKWLQIKADKQKIDNIKTYRKVQQKVLTILTKNPDNIDKKVVKDMLRTNVKIEKLHLDSKIGVEDVIVTSFLIAVSSSIVSFILANMIENPTNSQYYYKIEPIYASSNTLRVCLSCIFSIKIFNILVYIIKNKNTI